LCGAALFLFSTGCDEDDPAQPEEENPQELITKVTLTLTETGTTNTTSVSFSDLDGSGGNAPTIGTLTLGVGKTYTGTIALLDETKNPVENITEEVEEEADAHQFFYTVGGGIAGRLNVAITDVDSKNLPVGLEYTLTVTPGAAASGTLNVVLSHYDESLKDGVTPSDETDVDIDFPVSIVP